MVNYVAICILGAIVKFSRSTIAYLEEPQDDIIVIGRGNVTLTCLANSTIINGSLTVVWKHNDTWITDFDRKHYYQIADGSLFFMKFLSVDVGKYVCAVVVSLRNKRISQSLSRIATLQAAYLSDKFTYVTPSLSGGYGSTLHLQCITPPSVPLATIFWLKNNITLHNYKNASIVINQTVSNTLEIKNLTLVDAGLYQCFVKNYKFPNKIVKSKNIPLKITADRIAPYLILRPSPAVVPRFRKMQLHCIILGDPPPKIFWKKENITLNNTLQHVVLANGTLEIRRVDYDDGGLYACVGENFFGSIQSIPVTLTVAFIEFEFAENPLGRAVTAGTNLTLNCKPPKSYPLKPSTVWYCNYKKVLHDKRIAMLSNFNLHITNVSLNDEGEYFCQATNEYTKEARTSRKAKVIIQVLPNIDINSTTYSIILENPLKVQVVVTGIPSPNTAIYKHLDNGTLISLVQSTALFIPSVDVSDSGRYVFVAENNAGRMEKIILVNVLVPPHFTIQPTNISTVANDDVIITCQVSGTPAPFVHWTFTDLFGKVTGLIHEKDLVKIETDGLHVRNISKLREGWYSCSANNSAGSIQSHVFLKVYVNATVLLMRNSLTLDETQNVNINCTAFGDPIVSLNWQHNGKNLTSNRKNDIRTSLVLQKNLFYTTSTLFLANVTIVDDGMYSCIAENKYGVSNTNTTVNIQVHPRIEEFDIAGIPNIGRNLMIHCAVAGSPNVVVSLIRNRSIIMKSSNTTEYRKNLTFIAQNISSSDSGAYICIARNKLGVSQRNETVIVKVYPNAPSVENVVHISPTSMQIYWRDTFNGHSTVIKYVLLIRSNDKPDDDGMITNINATRKKALIVTSLQPYTLYDVQMSVENEIGLSRPSAVYTTRTVPAAPSPAVNLSVANKTSRTISLTWNHPTTPNGIVAIFLISFNKQNKSFLVNQQMTSYSYLLTSLVPNFLYKIQAKGATSNQKAGYNWGNFSNLVVLKTLQEVPSGVVDLIEVAMVTSKGFHVTFLPPDSSEIYGRVTSFHVRLSTPFNEPIIFLTNNTWYVFGNLHMYTAYTIDIAVANEMGVGRYSKGVNVKTHTGIPGVVRNLTTCELNETTIKVSWMEPTKRNGVIQGYTLNITAESSPSVDDFVLNLSNVTTLYLQNLTGNVTYFVRILATTSAGDGSNSHPHKFFVSEQFTGVKVRATLEPATITPVDAETLWLDREYLIVIVALASLSSVLLIAFFIICCVRVYYGARPFKSKNNIWELNPYYESANNEIVVGNKFSEKKRPSIPTDRLGDLFEEDFIWDDQLVNDIIEGSSMEPDYAVAITPVAKQTGTNYDGVEPYQGRNADLSPLVKLKGMSKNKRHPKIPNFQSPVQTPSTVKRNEISYTSMRNEKKIESLSGQRLSSVSSSSSGRSVRSSTPRNLDTDSTLSSRRALKRSNKHRDRGTTTTMWSSSSSTTSSATSISRLNHRSKKIHKNGGNYANIAVLPQGDLKTLDYKVQL